MTSIDPNQTLYVTNLNSRITVEGENINIKMDSFSLLIVLKLELKSNLYGLFATYGYILDITAKKTEKMREQAFIVYSDVASASTAKRSLNGFTFMGKPIKIDFAKTKSDAVAKLDGTYRLRTFHSGSNEVLGKRVADEEMNGNTKMARSDDSDDDDDDHA
ncbi:U2 small nuclear ribonucleoprotein B'' [Choanephora cucurbitarum]|uniref:U2 small nuclear ribonucleoprotein B n=1 Tax=Choanephora cucurbitarum TaxID=101091 RepID=A0A1C7NC93_9FUNG|nr:U2 small nuclear ribonucleoprotein B'' [Choanephora cucurbitarum]